MADATPVPPARRNDLPASVDTPPVPTGQQTTVGSPEETDPASNVLDRIGRFRVRSRLGAGAFGDVYRAHDPHLDRVVALKVAKPGALDSPERVGRFLREARAAANLRHPNVVPVFDSGQDRGRHYIATGFVDGRTLEAEIEAADGKPSDLRRAAAVVRKLAEALGYAHRQGVVHRDVKPANVLVDAAGEPSLTDFGLAVRAGDEAVKTQDGRVLGTPAYMSPEQAVGRSAEATTASDQYALGVVLYEMATGRRPFDGPMQLVIFQQIELEPRRPRAENPAIPRDLETVILTCLAKDPRKRYLTCEALAEDLRRFLAGEVVAARRVGPVERTARWARRNPAVAGSSAAAVLALLVGTGLSLWQASEARPAADNERSQKTIADAKTVEAQKNAADLAAESKKLATSLDEANTNLSNAKVLQAWTAWGLHDAKRTRELLRLVPEGYRRWEWHYLMRQTDGGLFTLFGHTGVVNSATFSPDGSRVVTASKDHTARVWDAATGQTIAVLKGHTEKLTTSSFSPDGARVVTASEDRTARVTGKRSRSRHSSRRRPRRRRPSAGSVGKRTPSVG